MPWLSPSLPGRCCPAHPSYSGSGSTGAEGRIGGSKGSAVRAGRIRAGRGGLTPGCFPGLAYICEGLKEQRKGLVTLVLWNNQLTHTGMAYLGMTLVSRSRHLPGDDGLPPGAWLCTRRDVSLATAGAGSGQRWERTGRAGRHDVPLVLRQRKTCPLSPSAAARVSLASAVWLEEEP